MNRIVPLMSVCLLVLAASGCQLPGQGQQKNPLFGFSADSRPAWLGGSGSSKGPLGNLFASRNQNQNTSGIQLPNDPAKLAQMFNSLASDIQSLKVQAGQTDVSNQQLHSELATYRQKIQAAGDYNYQLKQQLTDTIAQLQQVQSEKMNIEQQLAASRLNTPNSPGTGMLASGAGPVPSQLAGAPVIRANNSLLQKIPRFTIPGVSARQDGDVIRIEIPSDPLFVPGTYQVSPQYGAMLQEIAQVINRDFSRQIIGVESHWDGTPIQPPTTTHHQLTATQSLSVVDYMKRLGLPEQQLFSMAMGSNRPRYPSGPANRRLEVVIYPETWDGK